MKDIHKHVLTNFCLLFYSGHDFLNCNIKSRDLLNCFTNRSSFNVFGDKLQLKLSPALFDRSSLSGLPAPDYTVIVVGAAELSHQTKRGKVSHAVYLRACSMVRAHRKCIPTVQQELVSLNQEASVCQVKVQLIIICFNSAVLFLNRESFHSVIICRQLFLYDTGSYPHETVLFLFVTGLMFE